MGDSSGVAAEAGSFGGEAISIASGLGRATERGGDFCSVVDGFDVSGCLSVNPAGFICSSSPYEAGSSLSGEKVSKLLAALVIGLGPLTLLAACECFDPFDEDD